MLKLPTSSAHLNCNICHVDVISFGFFQWLLIQFLLGKWNELLWFSPIQCGELIWQHQIKHSHFLVNNPLWISVLYSLYYQRPYLTVDSQLHWGLVQDLFWWNKIMIKIHKKLKVKLKEKHNQIMMRNLYFVNMNQILMKEQCLGFKE